MDGRKNMDGKKIEGWKEGRRRMERRKNIEGKKKEMDRKKTIGEERRWKEKEERR